MVTIVQFASCGARAAVRRGGSGKDWEMELAANQCSVKVGWELGAGMTMVTTGTWYYCSFVSLS